ncbi:MAG: DUF4167 domain-containing protein [Alphaproteobacteria bacterium]
MISNRQGGRRRGRGGQRGQSLGGNRQDNRQRGNAAQLLEKYKNLARDAQLAGDRVQAEYYLQYADHYFRVLGESRARFEDQRRQRGDEPAEESETEEEMVEAAEEDRPEPETRRPRGNGRDRSSRNGMAQEDIEEVQDERIAFEALPPAIGQDTGEDEEPAPKPRRRTRRVRSDDDEADIAPAA